ncbi:hypothetical protein HYC85_026018 [Camellia sinensis]|uniref:Fe2OG dioxygenase domain-containing protein n=1 Tax=Camellia sinensis TaxID=4442 RepID=A0A7J7G2I1_CAMSI|nr:hypothetical protein HYC85_026018 [Camellia sinensis]
MMDEKSPPPAMVESLVSKPVQEVVANSSNQVPERYIYKGEDGAIDASFPLLEVPVIDILRLLNSSSDDDELLKLRSALASCGCFQAINHGMESSFLDKLQEIAKQFFVLPIEEKHKYSRTVEDLEGYGNDSVLSEHQILDWTDRLYLIVSPEDQRKLKFWPQNPECFSMENEQRCSQDLTSTLHVQGLIVHLASNHTADGTAITFLLQDKEVEGLQILNDGQWFRVPIIPHALLINVGDQAEIMSNGMFKSPVHRVVTNSERERITLAVFCMPESNNEIEPVEGLIDEQRPREILHDYTTKLAMLNELVLKSMAKSLNLEENCFLNQYGERGTMFARFNFYPPCPRPDRTLGLKPHADGSAITFLLQDKEVEGLQILKDGQWFRVPIIPHALLINVGDQAEIMSNGMFKSPVHRVVTNSERERITLAVFCMPESNNEIEPVEGLIDEKRPRLYRSMKDYGNIYFQNYQLGKRPIDAAKL